MAAAGQSLEHPSSRATKRLTVNEAINLILEDGDDMDSADIYLDPPSDNDHTDEDSGDEEGLDLKNLSGRQLRARCSVTMSSKTGRHVYAESDEEETDADDDAQDDYEPVSKTPKLSRRRPQRKSTERNSGREWVSRDKDNQQQESQPTEKWTTHLDSTPLKLFELFFDEHVMGLMKSMSELYARQNGKVFSVTVEELKVAMGIIILSGYIPVPRRRMFWENKEDSRNDAVANSMSLNRFEEVLRFLHFSDNSSLDKTDKMAKIRPLFDCLNERFLKHWPPSVNVNVDESMVPYYGRHGAKQFIRGKPIRYGYKMWCLNEPTGYLIQTEPYRGKGTVDVDPRVGVSGSVVLNLMKVLPSNNHHIFFDNLFTSFPLLEIITETGMQGTGTIRGNRTQKCPLKTPEEMKKRSHRGEEDHKLDTSSGIIVVRWHDNSIATIASTAWWWPLFIFGISSSTQNAWLLYRQSAAASSMPLDYLGFLREIALPILIKNRSRHSSGKGRPLALHKRISQDVRFDGTGHFIMSGPTQRRCVLCGKKTKKLCAKCPECPLHEACFPAFHEK